MAGRRHYRTTSEVFDRPVNVGGGSVSLKVGLLTSALAAPGGFVGTPSTATAQPYKVATAGGTPATDGDEITLHNYHPSIYGSTGDYFVAVRKWGMWYVIDVECQPPEEP